MDSAVSLLFKGEGGLLRDKTIGTPGRSNRPLSEPRCVGPLSRMQRNEQVAYDRLPARRGEYFLRELTESKQAEPQPDRSTVSERRLRASEKPWSHLEQALKATDLLLQAGGFAVIVLDMSDVLPQQAMRIPLASWYRFRLAAEQEEQSNSEPPHDQKRPATASAGVIPVGWLRMSMVLLPTAPAMIGADK